MRQIFKIARGALPQVLAVILSLAVALPIGAYDYPLSSTAIRDAYFLGRRQGGLGTEFLAEYQRSIPSLRVEQFISFARIETPFVQVAVQSSRKLNYSAQDALEDFRDKPLDFRIHFEICYMPDAPPDAVKIKLIQNRKEILPDSVERSGFYAPADVYTRLQSIGEVVDMKVDAAKFDSSSLTIQIDTPNDQHTKVEVDLRALR